MVACISFLSQGWGKIYLIKTKDEGSPHHYKSEAGDDYGEDYEASETSTVAIRPFNEEDLDREDVQGQDYGILEDIKSISRGTEKLLSGANSLLRSLLPHLPKENFRGYFFSTLIWYDRVQVCFDLYSLVLVWCADTLKMRGGRLETMSK